MFPRRTHNVAAARYPGPVLASEVGTPRGPGGGGKHRSRSVWLLSTHSFPLRRFQSVVLSAKGSRWSSRTWFTRSSWLQLSSKSWMQWLTKRMVRPSKQQNLGRYYRETSCVGMGIFVSRYHLWCSVHPKPHGRSAEASGGDFTPSSDSSFPFHSGAAAMVRWTADTKRSSKSVRSLIRKIAQQWQWLLESRGCFRKASAVKNKPNLCTFSVSVLRLWVETSWQPAPYQTWTPSLWLPAASSLWWTRVGDPSFDTSTCLLA